MDIGFLLVALGGILAGLFLVPTMTTPRWQWENIWFLGSAIALVLVPWPLALLTVPNLGAVYREAGIGSLAWSFVFGLGWGLGGIFWGRALLMLGMGLGISIMVGLVNVFGSPVPLAIKDLEKLFSPGGLLLLLAMGILIVGVAVCAVAGKRRDDERLKTSAGDAKIKRASFAVAMLFCLLAGSLSAMNNFGPIFGESIIEAASAAGASELGKMNAMWAPLFTANFLVNGSYALFLMHRRKTFSLILSQGSLSYWLQAAFMGIAWPMCLVVYGMGVNRLGEHGAYTAYPLFLGAMILTGNAVGMIRGEWRGASGKTRALMAAGVLLLAAAFLVLGKANQALGAEMKTTNTYFATERRIEVDGDPADWRGIEPVVVQGERHLWFGQGMTRKNWLGNDDLSYVWRAAWHGDKLYFLFEVNDDKVLEPIQKSSYLCDSVEIFLDYGNRGGQRVKVLDGRDDWFARCNPGELMGYEMHFTPTAPPRVYLDHRDQYAADKPHTREFIEKWSGEAAMKKTPSGYVLEIGFAVPSVELAPGKTMGIEVGVNDDDGPGRKSIMIWPATKSDFWLTMNEYGKIVLTQGE